MTSKQRAYLRALSNSLDAIFQVGKNGINEPFIKQVDDVLEARELIKFSILETAPDSHSVIANEVALKTGSTVVQIIGNKVILYRAKKKNPKILLPN